MSAKSMVEHLVVRDRRTSTHRGPVAEDRLNACPEFCRKVKISSPPVVRCSKGLRSLVHELLPFAICKRLFGVQPHAVTMEATAAAVDALMRQRCVTGDG